MDEEVRKPISHEVGMPIDTMSVEELAERIKSLEGEIERLRLTISARDASRRAADAAFNL